MLNSCQTVQKGVLYLVKREEYLDKLIELKDKKVIKIITGVRRCGKSTLMEIFKNYLLEKMVLIREI